MKKIQTIEDFRKVLEWSSEYLPVKHLRHLPSYHQFINLLNGLDTVFPNDKLNWLATDDPNNPEFMSDRQQRLKEFFPKKTLPRSFTVINSGSENFLQVNNVVTCLNSGELVGYEVFFLLPLSAKCKITILINLIGESLDPYFIQWMPPAEQLIISHQIYDAWKNRDFDKQAGYLPPTMQFISTFPHLELPMLKRIENKIELGIGIPDAIGWINYWSPETCELLSFPDPATDGYLIRLSHRTPSGAWMVKLTEDMFDVTRPDHIEALKWAYQRFYQIGARV
ncbi:DUF5953 family protein [Methylovulum miyakonense]|uniref:DUF5953 family protein n=1 Tax=Methylovulum miyakonense TaxID=645578 RepID=UPI0003824A1C|nr:DUF5953 family protein [Methylovulum miyakonense]